MNKPMAGIFKILIVDDDPTERMLMRRAVESDDTEVYEAASGEDALEMYQKELPDLVLLDVIMPGMDGFSTCKAIRNLPEGRNATVIIVTGRADQPTINEAFKAGAIDFITKPVNWPLVNHHVRFMLRASHSIQDLYQSKMNLAEVQRIAKMGSWTWMPDEKKHIWSEQLYRLLKLDPERDVPGADLFLACLQCADQERVIKALEALETQSIPFLLECEAVRGRVESCSLLLRGEWVRGEQDYISIVAQDIAEQKRAEDELHLAAITFESHHSLMITDASGVIQRVNHAFTQMSGYCGDELVGKTARVFKSQHHDNEFYAQFWQSLQAKGRWEGEIWNCRKNGEEYPLQLSVTAVGENSDKVNHYVAHYTDISEKKKTDEYIHSLAYYDSLTGLPNRGLFQETLDYQLRIAKRNNTYGAMIFIDLDHFKVLNDSLGHQVGDELLKQFSISLRSVLREQDMLSRFGGDEFLILLAASDSTQSQAADRASFVAEKVLKLLEQPFQLRQHIHQLSCSIGITLLPQRDQDSESLIKQSDLAMYRGKLEGRSRYCFYEKSMQDEVDRRLEVESGLRQALEQHELILYYQPQVDQYRQLVGVEALVRWQHPQKGMIFPDDFISVAEQSNLIFDLGEEVLCLACQQLKTWQDKNTPIKRVSVNISSNHFIQPTFVNKLESTIRKTGANPESLCLEITENVFASDFQALNNVMERIEKLGVQLSIDDFGTGYSSLSYLKNLRVAELKIDRGFIENLVEDSQDSALVKTIIDMAQNFDLLLIAEGVETIEQFNRLKQLGCDGYQGYYFGKPQPIDQFERWLKDLGMSQALKITSNYCYPI